MCNSALLYLPPFAEPPMPEDPRLTEEAQNPNTSPSRLRELCGLHSRYKEAVAKNPNTPIEQLLLLWAEYPEAMLENPATDLLLLENPAAFAQAAGHILKAIFSLPNTPVAFYYIVWDSTPHYRELMASSASLPHDLALLLSKSENLKCRSALASNQGLAKLPEILAILEDDLFPVVRRGVAQNPALPFIYFEKLSLDWDSEVRENIAANPKTPAIILEKLSHDKIRDIRLAVRKNIATPQEIKEFLAHEPEIKRTVANWPKPIIRDSGIPKLLPEKIRHPASANAMILRPKT